MRVAAVVVAGGRGERFGGPKQFVEVDGHSLAERSVAAARAVADVVVLVVPDGYDRAGEGADLVVTGGATRSASVRAGLDVVRDCDVVVVHDAARPLASPDLFRHVVDALSDPSVDAAIPGVAVTDTIKRVSADGRRVLETVPRETLISVQTPQAFRRATLVRAHEGGAEATDDAALIEAVGGVVAVVPGERTNLKVTSPGDLERVARTGEVRT